MSGPTVEHVRRLLSDILNVPAEAVSADSSPATLENWDSLQQLNLVLALEQAFELNFDPDEIAAMRDVAQIAAAVDAKLAEEGRVPPPA